MSKRQALGAIAINSNAGLAATNAVLNNRASNVKVGAGGTAAAGSGVFKPMVKATTTAAAVAYNNENQPPAAGSSKLPGGKPGEFEFEIFQEERLNAGQQHQQQQNHQSQRQPLSLLPNSTASLRLQEKQVNFFLDVPEKDDQEEDEEDEEIAHDKRKHDDDEDDGEEDEEEEEEEEDKENDEDDLEEEGISRLNIAAMMDSASSSASLMTAKESQPTEMNMSHCELMMDMSSSTQNDDSVSSPMLLDDTIKGAASLKSAASSLYIEDEEEEEEEGESGDEQAENELDDEEVQRRLESIERDNVMMNFAEYKDEILLYMRKLELENRPKPTYMRKQMDITSNMRSILVDWLVEVCEEYKLNPETLYLAVNYTDRFLSQMSVLRGKLQLVGTAGMYIAAKYEEITPPDISEFVYITDDTYTKKQVLRMEHLLLKVLDFKMSSPTANWFLSYYLRFIRQSTNLIHHNDLGKRIENLARYLCELTLIDSDTYLAYLPSQIAASAVYLAMYTLGRPWTKQIADICGGYSQDLGELKSCIQEMFKTMQGALEHPQQAIQEKYKQNKYDYVALIEPPKTLPAHLTSAATNV